MWSNICLGVSLRAFLDEMDGVKQCALPGKDGRPHLLKLTLPPAAETPPAWLLS